MLDRPQPLHHLASCFISPQLSPQPPSEPHLSHALASLPSQDHGGFARHKRFGTFPLQKKSLDKPKKAAALGTAQASIGAARKEAAAQAKTKQEAVKVAADEAAAETMAKHADPAEAERAAPAMTGNEEEAAVQI